MSVAFTINGLRVGDNDPRSRPYWRGTVDGLGDAGASVTSEARVQADGQWSTTPYRQAKAMGISGTCRVNSAASVPAAISQLNAAVSLRTSALTVHWPSGDATRWVRRDGDIQATPVTDQMITWSATVVADDPTWYVGDGAGSADLTPSTLLPFTTGGLVFPATFPAIFTGSSGTGDITLTTTAGGRMWWRIDGPVVNPQVTTVGPDGTERTVGWALTLADGEWLDVDVEQRRSMLLGQASRPPAVRQWPLLQPGLSTIRFRSPEISTTARLTVRARLAL